MIRIPGVATAGFLIALVSQGCYMKFEGTETVVDSRLQSLEQRVAALEEQAGVGPIPAPPVGPRITGPGISPTSFSDDRATAGDRKSGQSGKVRISSQPASASGTGRVQTVTSDSLDLN